MSDVVIVLILFLMGGYLYIRLSFNKDKKINQLEQKKQSDQTQIDQLKTEANGLKTKTEKEQTNATEEQKKEFWSKELNSDSNNK